MGCASSKEENEKEKSKNNNDKNDKSNSKNGKKEMKDKRLAEMNGNNVNEEGSGPRPYAKSLSTYNKTKGGSMVFNLSSRSHVDPDDPDFTDDQHIMSPPEADWKLGKSLKRAPTMKQTHYFPVKVNNNDKQKVLCAVGYTTLQGKNPKPPHKPNQDSLSIVSVNGYSNLAIFSVFDGHGPYGEHASHYCRASIHEAFLKNSKDVIQNNPQQALEVAINDIHTSFCSDKTNKAGVDPVVSGTTLVSILLDGTKLIAANVGDSRAILGSYKEDHTMKIIELTDDHKPQRDDERKRLEEAKAILLTEREIRGFGDESKIYICREKGGDIVYGVLFTRSIGDFDAHENLGVSAKPEVLVHQLTSNDRYLILASDGVWDYMTNEEVMDIAMTIKDPLKSSEEITKTAKSRWAERDQDGRRDDITVLVVKLEIVEKEEGVNDGTDIIATNDS